jgi:UDP-3-O-[3-hydroxymyristoyl] N-acetylglucosamine deacetylase
MSLLTQSTIADKVFYSGIGIHTGEKVNLSIFPASPNTGIIFKRIDLKQNNVVIPNFENVCEATLCTTISNEHGVRVSTIEHLMGAFLGLGIDNAIVELDSQEVPILDGSAIDFVKVLKKTGLRNSDIPIKLIKINNHVELKEGNKFISIDKSNTSL